MRLRKICCLLVAVSIFIPDIARCADALSAPASSPVKLAQAAPVKLSKSASVDKPAKSGFWKTRSAKKLWWGLALVAVGAGGAAYGLSKKTEHHTQATWVNDPSKILFGGTGAAVSGTDGSGNLISMTFASAGATNWTGTATATNVVITIVSSSGSGGTGTIYGQGAGTIASLAPGASGNCSVVINFSPPLAIPGPGSMQFNTASITQALFAGPNVTTSSSKTKSSAVGYVGVGAAAVGASFLISYLASSALPTKKAEAFDVDPVVYYARGGSYQGIKMSWSF